MTKAWQLLDEKGHDVWSVGPDTSVFDAISEMARRDIGALVVMTKERVRHLPVLFEERLVGIVSIGDLVKSVIADQKFAIEQLEQFIRS